MEPINPQSFQGYSKQELFALFREFLEEYYKEKEKELHEVSLIERVVRVEEELKSLRKEMSYRFEALLREMNARFEALEKRFNFLQWTMMLGFTILSILITVFNFLKG
jgi:predicted nuclease with TOPRIM domain